MRDTIQRIIGLAIGVVISLVLMPVMTDATIEQAFVPLIIGAVVAFFWPVAIAWFLVRRAKQRREGQIQSEVERQMNEQKRG